MSAIVSSPDAALIERFERADFDAFSHADHVRVAWAYLTRDGEGALPNMSAALVRFATARGVPGKFHVTLKRAWLDLISAARLRRPELDSPDALLAAFPQLADARTVARCYQPQTLASERARTEWVEPDAAPLASTL